MKNGAPDQSPVERGLNISRASFHACVPVRHGSYHRAGRHDSTEAFDVDTGVAGSLVNVASTKPMTALLWNPEPGDVQKHRLPITG